MDNRKMALRACPSNVRNNARPEMYDNIQSSKTVYASTPRMA